ncbi:hypothetical protein K505DRAFT_361184 [Melanomma pulvis-pyrius CBS 109.77]|uniref:Uncharacterized protein n=1 Tax=Melanomma pulvis-pyrius CBS 109.77 TaxID=1314802 RepID=A0A6A6XE42_9PLEO|nr:hypothetical protein K505DRAFT_361184 [Melanomma pulvis-pyrius CBS 109.77]
MANPHPGKRQRTEEPPSFDATKNEIWEALTRLDASFTQQLLFRLAMSQPRVASEIWVSYQSELLKESNQVLDFGIISEEVDTTMNQNYGNMGNVKQFEFADDVIEQILQSIATIQEEATKPNASFGTRRSALETLRHIGSIICRSEGVIPLEVVKSFRDDSALEDAMLAIVGCMTTEQRREMAGLREGAFEFREKMQDLITEGTLRCVFARMSGVLSALEGEGGGQPMSNHGSDTLAHIKEYYAKRRAGLVSSGAGIAAMNQFTASHNIQPHMSPHGASLPLPQKIPAAAQHYAPAPHFPSTSTTPQPQPQPYANPVTYQLQPQPISTHSYYSAPPYQPALGNLATRQYSAIPPPYQVDPRYSNQKYPPTAAQSQLASQAYPDQYWANKSSYQPPGPQ